jgi:hypothetical protein
MVKRIEKLAIIAMVLWLVSLVAYPMLIVLVARYARPESFAAMTTLDVMPISIKNIVASLVHIGVGVWLFKQARRDGNSPFVWTLFGFVFSITAVILYLLSELLKELKDQRSDNNQMETVPS